MFGPAIVSVGPSANGDSHHSGSFESCVGRAFETVPTHSPGWMALHDRCPKLGAID